LEIIDEYKWNRSVASCESELLRILQLKDEKMGNRRFIFILLCYMYICICTHII
jgi:hypothetical protein